MLGLSGSVVPTIRSPKAKPGTTCLSLAALSSWTVTIPASRRGVLGAGTGNAIFVRVVQTNSTAAKPKMGYAFSATTKFRLSDVGPWTIVGFDKPVDMGSMNSQKGGAPVPLKFEVFAGSVELTTLDAIASIEQQRFSCDTSAPMGTPTAIPAAPGFTLRYDAGAGQFVGKWDSPKLPGTCWLVNLRTADGSSISAAFKLK